MRSIGTLLACVWALGAFGARAAPPLEAYGQLPAIEQVALAPDGQHLAIIVTNGERRRVAIQAVGDHKIVGELDAGERKVRFLQWAGPNHILVTTSVTSGAAGVLSQREEWYNMLDYDIAARRQASVMGNINNAMNVVLGAAQVRMIDGKPFAFVPGVWFVNESGRMALFKRDLTHGVTELVDEGLEHSREFLVDAQGAPIAETDFDSKAGRWSLRIKRGAAWTTVKTLAAAIETPDLVGLGRDGRAVVLETGRADRGGLREFEPDAADWGPDLVGEGGAPLFDPATHALIGVSSLVGDERVYRFFAAHDQQIWQSVQRAYPGASVALESISADHRRLVVRVDSPTEGPGFALVDVDARSAVWIGDQYHAASAALAPVRAVSFKASDGLALNGYLTTPPGRDAKQLPLIVFPLGGPAARDEPGFDWWAQAMASRGYAVLKVNYRGSAGYGAEFLKAGFGQWGRKMQTDLSDGVAYLAAEGAIDPMRVCIVGASYGGYAALAGATLDSFAYRCAASVAGIADVEGFAAWSALAHSASSERYWLRFMGADSVQDPKLAAISPIDHIDHVTAPILLIHGKDDTVVPFEQTQRMAEALTRAGKRVQVVTLAGEDHWLSRGATRLQMLKAVIDFIEAQNPPG
jgi:dipeptidyl aminopeptidase/acylaminoacyl peptidase